MSNIIRVFATDPGLTNFGYALIEYNLSNGHRTVIKYGTITGKSLLKSQKDMLNRFEKRYIIIWELEKVLQEMILEMSPDYVVVESAFYHTFPSSFAALTMVIQAVRTATKNAMGRDIYLVAPRESKKAASADGNSNKTLVQYAIFGNPDITVSNKLSNIDELTEHSYDAIAAGEAFIMNHLPSILISRVI